MREPLPVFIAEKTIPHPYRVNSGLGAKHPHGKLLFGHFQRKYRTGNIVVNCGISNNIQGQSGFSHARARRQNDKIRPLKSGCQMIQSGETCGYASQKGFIALAFFQLVNIVVNQGRDMIEGRLDLVFGNLENSGFCKIQNIVNLTLIFKTPFDDMIGFFNESAQTAFVMDDSGIMNSIDGDRNRLQNLYDTGYTAHGLKIPSGFKGIGQSNQVNRLPLTKEFQHGCIYFLMGGSIKIIRSQDFNNVHQGAVVMKNRADNGFFSFETVGRKVVKGWVLLGFHKE